MITTILKVLSVLGLSFLATFTFILGQLPLVEGRHLFDPYIDTQFAKDYDPNAFDKIEVGMSVSEVKKIIGEPLYKGHGYKDTLNTNYYYTGDGKLLNSTRDNGQNGYGDFAWYRSTLEIDRTGKVVYIDKGWSHD